MDNLKIENRQKSKDVKTEWAKTTLYSESSFQNAPITFQKLTMALLDSTDNQEYLVRAAKNEQVIERCDYDLLEKVAGARTWLSKEQLATVSKDEVAGYLSTELDNYRYTMTVLTEDLVLDQENAISIMDAVFSVKTSSDACDLSKKIFTELKSLTDADFMVQEATAPKVQPENTGFHK